MASGMSCPWVNDTDLQNDLANYVSQNVQRKEILDYMERDYSIYNWSMRSLDRRLRHFGIYYIEKDVSIVDARAVVREEMNGPGGLLGYRAMHLKLRQKYAIKIPRDYVYNLMFEENRVLLEERRPGFKKKKEKIHFTTKGPDWVYSLDGRDKLMGYQNSTFPLAIYGCIDTASRKILFLRVWNSNSKPEIVGRWYCEYLAESGIIPNYLRVDKGTETTTMSVIHCFLRHSHGDLDDPTDSVLFGPSTSNQIERWWRELHERLEKSFKVGLLWLKGENHYDPNSQDDRDKLAFVMIPLVQKHLDEFKDIVWNPHRIRHQKNTLMPDGVPNHMYNFPKRYGTEQCGFQVNEDDLRNAVSYAKVLDYGVDYLDQEFRNKCRTAMDHEITKNNYVETYLELKYFFDTEE